jgi:hypothetical protein
MVLLIDFEEFFSWLASHASNESVGRPGRDFHSPLARFLSQKTGHVMGEDGLRYGWAMVETHLWRDLPQWAQVFASLSERSFGGALSAYEAVCVLVHVEEVLTSAFAA